VAAARAGVPEIRPDRQPRARPRLEIVAPPERRRRIQPRGWAAIGVVTLFVVLLALAAFHAELVSSQGRLDRLERQVAAQQHLYQSLRLEVARLEAPERVLNSAQYQLGMVPAGDPVFLNPSPEIVAAVLAQEEATAPPADGDGAAPPAEVTAAATASSDESRPELKPYLEPAP
jgi:cell division protein FtsL